VHLNNRFDAIRQLLSVARSARASDGRGIGVLPERRPHSLPARKECFELNSLYGALQSATTPGFVDRLEHLVVSERGELRGNLRLPLDEGQTCVVLDDLKIVPHLLHCLRYGASALRQGENADDLREVGIRRSPDQQPADLLTVFVGVPY